MTQYSLKNQKGAIKLKRLVFFIIAIFILCVFSAGCKKPAPPQKETAGASVKLGIARTGLMTDLIEVSGQIKALKWTSISANKAGKIISVPYREGDTVSAGAVVAIQDTADLASMVRQAEAGVLQAKARLSQAVTGAGVSDTQTEAGIAQAKAALDSAKASLQLIKKGARNQEVKSAENAVASAEANAKNAEITLKRTRDLYAQGAQSKQQMDMVQMQYDIANAQLDTAQQQLSIVKSGARDEEIIAAQKRVEQADEAYKSALSTRANKSLRQEDIKTAKAGVAQAEAQLSYAQQQLNDAYLRTQVGGIVSKRNVEPGQTVGTGTILMEIVALDSIYFEATVSEMDIAKIKMNQTVAVSIDALPGRKFAGTVQKILPVADSSSRQFTLRIRIDNRSGELKPGMFARGGIEIGRHANVVIIPKDAIISSKDGLAVYVVEGNTAKQKVVKLGYETREEAEALSGVRAGDKLVVLGQDKLSDGVKVNAVN